MIQLFYSAAETITPAGEQTASAPPSLFITIVASAFGGALLTSLVTIWAKFADSKAEHEKWLRNEKYNAYVDAQLIFHSFKSEEHATDLLGKDPVQLITDIHSALSRIEMLAPANVRDAVKNTREKLGKYEDDEEIQAFKDAIAELLVAMRGDLLNHKPNKG